MKKLITFGLLMFLWSGISCVAQWNENGGIPFTMPAVDIPTFKADTFNITKYGAVGDGLTMNTQAIAKAIEACSVAGGGVVLIPRGLWLTGPIELKSNINLHAADGALVLFSRNFDDYAIVRSYWEGLESYRCKSPISGADLQNIAVTGKGVFDGSGDMWRQVKKSKVSGQEWNHYVASGGVLTPDKNTWYPSEKSKLGNELYAAGKLPAPDDKAGFEAIKDFLRPMMVSFIRCNKVLLDGPVFQNSPSWCIHPLMCTHLTVQNVRVYNPWYAQNGDGIDVESCSIGQIRNSIFDAGDDAICIKSGRNEEGRKRGKPTEYFTIDNCMVYHGHGGFVIGSEMSGGVRNLLVSNCTFLGTDVGLRFKSTRGRGGVVENIYVRDVSMINIPTQAILFDLYYSGGSPIPEGEEKAKPAEAQKPVIPAVNEGTPQFKNFYVKNIQCNGAAQAVFLQGLPEMSIKNIQIENSSFKTDRGIACIEAENIVFRNVTVDAAKGPAATVHNSKMISIDQFKSLNSSMKLVKISGEKTDKISISGKGKKIEESEIEVNQELKNKIQLK